MTRTSAGTSRPSELPSGRPPTDQARPSRRGHRQSGDGRRREERADLEDFWRAGDLCASLRDTSARGQRAAAAATIEGGQLVCLLWKSSANIQDGGGERSQKARKKGDLGGKSSRLDANYSSIVHCFFNGLLQRASEGKNQRASERASERQVSFVCCF